MLNLYVVEGQYDLDKLKSLGCKYIYKINGLNRINQVKIEFLKQVEKVRKIVLVLDPDTPGKYLLQILKKALNKPYVVVLNQKYSKKHGKIGVAETKVDYLKSKLEAYINYDKKDLEQESISKQELVDLNLNEEQKSYLHQKYHINTLNFNEFYYSLLFLNLNKEQIKGELDNEFNR